MVKHKPYNLLAKDTLNDDGTYVEPDVRKAIKTYLDSMGLNDNKIKLSRKQLRALVREMLGADRYESQRVVCPSCGSSDVETWAADGKSFDADYGECLSCEHSDDIDAFLSTEEASTVMTRSNFITASDDQKDEELKQLEEFYDWAVDHKGRFDEKRYDLMAKQVYDSWPDHSQEVDWSKVVDIFLRLRSKNVHSEVDKDKLYEKVLSYAENHYQGNVPPTVVSAPTPGMKK